MTSLADRIEVLRDELLDTVERGDRDPPGAEIVDALVRSLVTGDPGAIDLSLRDAVARRLAWGDTEEAVLRDAGEVFARLLRAVPRAIRDPDEQVVIYEVAAEVATSVARVLALAALGRIARDRAACTREELAQRRLRDALAEQQANLARLAAELRDGTFE
jgi:hypothetical protein